MRFVNYFLAKKTRKKSERYLELWLAKSTLIKKMERNVPINLLSNTYVRCVARKAPRNV